LIVVFDEFMQLGSIHVMLRFCFDADFRFINKF